MKILWMNTQLFPSACGACGYSAGAESAWGEVTLRHLQKEFPAASFVVAYCDRRPCDVVVDGVRHVSYEAKEYYYYRHLPIDLLVRIKKLIEDVKPDIIHIHGTEAFYSALPIPTYCGVPVLVTIQGVIGACHPVFTGNLAPGELNHFWLNSGFVRHLSTPFSVQKFWREKRTEQEKRVFRNHKYFLGRTDWDKACVKYYNPNARYFSVNETLRPIFYRAHRKCCDVLRHTIYCSAAGSYPLKGLHWLIMAAASIKDQFPDISIRVANAKGRIDDGLGFRARFFSDTYSAYLRDLIKKLGMESHIVPLPRLASEDVAEELCHAQLFVLPSLIENSSNSLGEAQLIGVPAISTYVGGTPSQIRNGIDGVLVPPGDPFSLASAIRYWFDNPEQAEICAASAKVEAARRHDPDMNAKALARVYNQILSISSDESLANI